jgi:hypothetical protein
VTNPTAGKESRIVFYRLASAEADTAPGTGLALPWLSRWQQEVLIADSAPYLSVERLAELEQELDRLAAGGVPPEVAAELAQLRAWLRAGNAPYAGYQLEPSDQEASTRG